MKIQLIDFGGRIPERAHDNDAGADVFSPEDIVIRPGEISKISLGFGLRIPDGFAGYIFPRSGLSTKGLCVNCHPSIPAIRERFMQSFPMWEAGIMRLRPVTR